MHVAIALSGFDRRGVADGLLHPKRALGGIRLTVFDEHPHHARKEAVAPVRPCRSILCPNAIIGVQRIHKGMLFDKLPNLFLSEGKRLFELVTRVGRKMDHFMRMPRLRPGSRARMDRYEG